MSVILQGESKNYCYLQETTSHEDFTHKIKFIIFLMMFSLRTIW